MTSNDRPDCLDQEAPVEDALRHLAKQAFDLFAVTDFPSLRFLHINDEGRRLLHLDASFDVRETSLVEFGQTQFLTSLIYEIGPAALAGGEWSGETIFHSAAGHECPVRVFVAGLPATATQPARLALGAYDTSAAREARESLRTEQMLLRALLHHMPDSIFFKDAQSRYIRVSARMAADTRFRTPEKLVGLTDVEVFGDELGRATRTDEQRIMESGEGIIEQLEHTANNDWWGEVSKLPLRDERGRIIGTFGIARDITARKVAEEKLKTTQKELLAASRLAGMAEIASGVLHNLGNALNSVGTSAAILAEQFSRSRIQNLGKAAQMLEEHASDLAGFLSTDPRGKQLPAYFIQVAAALATEREQMLTELGQLRRNVEHMSEVVAMQQNYARASSLAEDCQAAELVEESLHISAISLSRHGITVIRDFKPTPNIHVTRHKVLQILVNLIRNAKYAMDESGRMDKPMTISIAQLSEGLVRVSVHDVGVGIAPENLTKIFGFGFTTRKDGHGFGLHSSANAARELGGHLTGHSDGVGKGAVFTLDLPVAGARIQSAPAVA